MSAFACLVVLLTARQQESDPLIPLRRLIQQSGIPVTAQELFPPYEGDPKLNAATYIDQLVSDQEKADKQRGGLRLPVAPALKDDTKAWTVVSSSSGEFDVIEKIAGCTVLARPRQGSIHMVTFPDLAVLKGAATKLSLRARLRAKAGTYATAVDDFGRIDKLAALAAQNPTAIPDLVRVAIIAIGRNAEVKVLPEIAADKTSAAKLRVVLKATPVTDYYQVMIGEAADYVSTLPLNKKDYLEHLEAADQPSERLEATRPQWGPPFVAAWKTILGELQ